MLSVHLERLAPGLWELSPDSASVLQGSCPCDLQGLCCARDRVQQLGGTACWVLHSLFAARCWLKWRAGSDTPPEHCST